MTRFDGGGKVGCHTGAVDFFGLVMQRKVLAVFAGTLLQRASCPTPSTSSGRALAKNARMGQPLKQRCKGGPAPVVGVGVDAVIRDVAGGFSLPVRPLRDEEKRQVGH